MESDKEAEFALYDGELERLFQNAVVKRRVLKKRERSGSSDPSPQKQQRRSEAALVVYDRSLQEEEGASAAVESAKRMERRERAAEERLRRMHEASQAELLAKLKQQQEQFQVVLKQLQAQQEREHKLLVAGMEATAASAAAAAAAASEAASAATAAAQSPASLQRKSRMDSGHDDSAHELREALGSMEAGTRRSQRREDASKESPNYGRSAQAYVEVMTEDQEQAVSEATKKKRGRERRREAEAEEEEEKEENDDDDENESLNGSPREDLWVYRAVRQRRPRGRGIPAKVRGLLVSSPAWTYHGCLYLNESEEASNAQVDWYLSRERARVPSSSRPSSKEGQRGRRRRTPRGGRSFLARNVRRSRALLQRKRVDLSLPCAGALFSDRWQEHSANWWSEPWSPPVPRRSRRGSTPKARDDSHTISKRSAPPPLADGSEATPNASRDRSRKARTQSDRLAKAPRKAKGSEDIGTTMELLLDEFDHSESEEEPEERDERDVRKNGSSPASAPSVNVSVFRGKRRRSSPSLGSSKAENPPAKKKAKTRADAAAVAEARDLDAKRAKRASVLEKHRKQSSRPAAANNRHRVHRRTQAKSTGRP